MTLRLLRNLRITRRNTRPASEPAEVIGVWPSGGWLLLKSRARLVGAAAAGVLICGAVSLGGDDPADPISKLGQRSALQRWRDARSEWTGFGARRERRQQMRQGGALENTFAPDVAAPAAPLPVVAVPDSEPEPPASVELSPVMTEAPPEAPRFLAPPKSRSPMSEQPAVGAARPAPMPVDAGADDADAAATAKVDAGPTVPALESGLDAAVPANPSPAVEQRPSAPVPGGAFVITEEGPDLAPFEPTMTAFLPQIPRTPVAPSPTPTPAPRSTRSAPPPPPKLPPESPSFSAPRSGLVVPPAPEGAPRPRVAVPVELPQLKKITEIQPFKNCAMDGQGVKLCPPNTAGPEADRCPEQQPLPVFEGEERNFIDIEYCWDAPNLIHAPLYFEDVPLERYGHTYCEPLQSIASVSKFGVQLAGIPYQMAMAPVHKCEYPLGYYRPGDPAPYKCYQIPLNAQAALKAAYVYTGLSFITP